MTQERRSHEQRVLGTRHQDSSTGVLPGLAHLPRMSGLAVGLKILRINLIGPPPLHARGWDGCESDSSRRAWRLRPLAQSSIGLLGQETGSPDVGWPLLCVPASHFAVEVFHG